jgi:hypothetical protein
MIGLSRTTLNVLRDKLFQIVFVNPQISASPAAIDVNLWYSGIAQAIQENIQDQVEKYVASEKYTFDYSIPIKKNLS